jgi:hypothetical protein
MTDSEPEFPHLNLRQWPFTITPSDETAATWIGRPETHRQLRMVLRSASRVPASQILLLWAGFGGGKTHALKHLEVLAREAPDLLPLYVVIPEGIKSFLDIYRAIIEAAAEAGMLAAAGRDLFDRTKGHVDSDVERALIRAAMYQDDQARLAVSWLKAEKVGLREVKDIGIYRRLESAADGVDSLNRLIQALQRGGSVKVILLMDEVQELETLGRKQDEALGGIHKVFDRNTSGLTVVLSFMTATQSALKGIIGETIMTRASSVLTLKPLESAEAVEFIAGLLAEWSVDRDKAPAPFTPDAIEAVVGALKAELPELSPREVIKHFNRVLREADLDITDGEISEIDAAYALDRLEIEREDADGAAGS